MQIDQIIIRPAQELLIVQYSDATGRSNNFTLNTANDANVAAIVSDAQGRLPSDSANPAKPEIQKEIADLENRIQVLKQAIGVA